MRNIIEKISINKLIAFMIIVFLLVGCSTNNSEVVEEEKEETIEYSTCVHTSYIPEEFGKPQYSVEEIRAMKDYSLDELKNSISTIYDLAQWYCESGFIKNKSIGDYKYLLDNGYILSLHQSPQTIFENQLTCCGCISTLSNYILEGDYDEQGYIYTADCSNNEPHGGHVYNYFSNNGEILTVDFLGLKLDRLDRCRQVHNFEELNNYNKEWDDYLFVMIAIKDYNGNFPPLFNGTDNGHGSTLSWFFDSYYKDHIVKINYDTEQMQKFDIICKITNYIEDTGFDPSIIDQEKIDKNIDNWDNTHIKSD